MQDCVFCKIVTGGIPSHKVYEDDSVLAFLDRSPVNPGHTLVIPKEHHRDLLDTPPELGAKLMNAIQKIAPAILAGVGADSFNLGVNNGAGAGQIVFHAHLHIMPRFRDDGHQLWHGRQADQNELAKVAEDIKKHL
ncbi:MAG: HIT family protein [Parcubacteria group bacterium]|nr:HIT family protein [Parcubacteria group bacterium]